MSWPAIIYNANWPNDLFNESQKLSLTVNYLPYPITEDTPNQGLCNREERFFLIFGHKPLTENSERILSKSYEKF